MNPSDYRICLDVQAPHGAVELDAKQGDSERRIFITLTDGGVPYGITEDCRPLLTAKKPDGTVLYNLCHVEQNTAIYTLTRQTTACPGRVRCELRLYGSSFELDEEGKPSADSAQLLTAATFTLLVHSQVCSDEDAIASLPESTQLEQLVTDTQALLTHVQTKLEQGDFVGEKGDTGEKGEKGDRGEKGEKGEKGDPGAVMIDDGAVGSLAWSAKNTVDKLCPSFWESGAVVTCEPVEGYPLDVEWQAKNLINPIAYMRDSNSATTLNGDVFTSVTTNGSVYLNTGWGGKLETHPAGTYTVTVIPVSEGVNFFVVINSKASGTQLFYKKANASNGYTFTFTAKEEFYLQITGGDSTMWGTHSYKLQLEEGATATAYEPYAETATITQTGKNLVNPADYMKDGNERTTRNGDVFTSDTNSGSTFLNTNWGNRAVSYPAGTYTVTIIPVSDNVKLSILIYSKASKTLLANKVCGPSRGYSLTYTANERFYVSISGGDSSMWGRHSYKLQVECGGESTSYESYKSGSSFSAGSQIPALPGVNTLWASSGEITVTGKADPVAELDKLKTAILSLGGNI